MWEQVFSFNQSQNFSSFLVDYDFSGSYLIVKSVCKSAKSNWIKVGYCSPLFSVPNIGLIRGKSESIKLGSQLVRFDNPLHQSFKLDFFLHPWLPTINLTFYTYSGQLDDAGDRLALIEQDLIRIETKIDSYSSNT